MKPIVIPLPNAGFDPTEAAVPWSILKARGIDVQFATPDGRPASADPLMVTGEGLDLWGWLPVLRRLKLVGLFLRADRRGRNAYRALLEDPAFRTPLRYEALRSADFDGLLLPGGHAKPMRPYLESPVLRAFVVDFFATAATDGPASGRPIGAICHGVVVAARATTTEGRSVLHGRKVTALPWAFERKAWSVARISRFWEPDYYRTYLEAPGEPAGWRSVELEVRRSLRSEADFLDVPRDAPWRSLKTDAMHRDRLYDDRPAWVVEDGNLITARWPGDAHTFGVAFLRAVERYRTRQHPVPS